MRGYINHDLEIKRIKEAATKHKIDVNAGLLDAPERLEFLGVSGLTMRKLAEDKVIDMFTRIVNYAKPEWTKFRDILATACNSSGITFNDSFLNNSPIIIMHPKLHDKLIVFTSLVMDTYEDRNNPFYWARVRLLKQAQTFVKAYFADVADTKRAMAWATTHRAKKRLLRYEVVDAPRALTRYLPELVKHCTAAQIRDLGTTIAEYNAPVELTYADTDPSDFFKMYNGGPDSCMKDNGTRQFSWMSRLAKPVHPTSIFAYSPYVRGCYLVKGSKVVARTFIYDLAFFAKAKTQSWAHGRLYGSTSKYTEIFRAALTKANIVDLSGTGADLMRSYTITVPPISVSDDEAMKVGVAAGKYMYVPYLDNHCQSAHVEYNEDTDMLDVTFNPPKGKPVNCQMNNQHGFMPASSFRESNCHACGGKIEPGSRTIFASDGSVFHDQNCAKAAGYVNAINGAGPTYMWVHRSSPTLIMDCMSNHYFTPSGATIHRVLPLLTSFKENPEDVELYSSDGIVVELHGKRYRMRTYAFHDIPSRYLITKMDSKAGYEYWIIDPAALNTKYIDIQNVRTVILPEDHTHVDASVLRELERLAA